MKKIALMLCALALTGCSSAPNKMYFSPQPVATQQRVYQGQAFSIAVVDNRRTGHLLEIVDSDGNKKRHPAANPIQQQLTNNLSQGFSRQGLNISDYAPGSIELSIIQLETVVAQEALKYQASFAVEFKITIKQNGKTYNKTFTGHSQSTGVLKSDIASMEQSLNSLAAQVLSDIFNDSFIQQSIKA